MLTIGRIRVSKEVNKLIEQCVTLGDGPYEFIINDGYGKVFNLGKRADKIATWAKRNGADVKIKLSKNGFHFIMTITDPVASHLEMGLREMGKC